METIDKFEGDYAFLSNFYPCSVYLNHGNEVKKYSSVEHAFQAAKTSDMGQRELIRTADTAGMAKKLGQKVKLRDSWNVVRHDIMYKLLRQKFTNDELRGLLLRTGDAQLVEGNTWGDKYWGVVDGEGENHLGKTLMRVRQDIVDAKIEQEKHERERLMEFLK